MMRALFIETNPIPIKHATVAAQKMLGRSPHAADPDVPAPADKLKAVMKEMKLL